VSFDVFLPKEIADEENSCLAFIDPFNRQITYTTVLLPEENLNILLSLVPELVGATVGALSDVFVSWLVTS